LAQDTVAPLFGFAFAYTLPPDILKVTDYGGTNPSTTAVALSVLTGEIQNRVFYKIEGRKLLSNDGKAFIQYIRRVTNPDEWDPLFYQVVTTQLASKLALAITKDPKKAAQLLEMAVTVLLPQALAVDGQEGSVEPFVVDDLTWGR